MNDLTLWKLFACAFMAGALYLSLCYFMLNERFQQLTKVIENDLEARLKQSEKQDEIYTQLKKELEEFNRRMTKND